MKYYFITSLLLVFIKSFGQTNISVGEKAPEINITEWIENAPENKDLSNQFIVLDFWATWCAPCISSVPHINYLVDKYQDRVTFISITNEKSYRVKRTLERIEFKSAVANDTTMATSRSYGKPDSDYTALPMIVLIDNKNDIQWIGTPRYLTEDVMDQFLDGTLDGSNMTANIQIDEELEEETGLDSFNSFFEWYKFTKQNHDFYFDMEKSKVKNPSAISSEDMFASESIDIYALLAMAWSMNQRDIKLPKKLGGKQYQVMYRNTEPKISYGDDLATEILKKLKLSVNSVPVEREGLQIELENTDRLDKTKDEKFSSFSEDNGLFLFTRFTLQDALDEVATYTDAYLFFSFPSEELYDFTIDASSDRKLIESLESYGFKLTETKEIVENKIITFHE